MSERSVHLQGYIKVPVSETDVRAERRLRRSLSRDVTVATVAQVNLAVVVEVFDVVGVASVLVLDESLAVRQVKDPERLPDNLIDDIVVAAVLSGTVQ